MAITPPENTLWWKEPLHGVEIIWVTIAFLWGLVMFFAMIYWHFTGEQNLSNEAYRIKPEAFAEKTEAMVEQYQVGEEGDTGIPVVRPPPGSAARPGLEAGGGAGPVLGRVLRVSGGRAVCRSA